MQTGDVNQKCWKLNRSELFVDGTIWTDLMTLASISSAGMIILAMDNQLGRLDASFLFLVFYQWEKVYNINIYII